MNSLHFFIRSQIANLRIKNKDFLLFVEDELDKTFWETVLQQFNLKQKPQVLPSVKSASNNRATGKSSILKYRQFCNEYPQKVKIAIDSDYDYLLDSGNYNIQNHILQTYTYSIENYFCYAPSLESLCLEKTQSKSKIGFDFENFLIEYSQIIYPLFIISLLYEQNRDTSYSITNFCNDIYIDFQLIKIDDVIPSLKDLKEQVEIKLNTLKGNFSNEDYQTMKNNIAAKGVSEENCYLFIKGHFLLEKFLSPIIKNITNQLSQNIGDSFTDNKEKNKYFSKLKSSTDLLKSNYNFSDCPIFTKLKADISTLQQQIDS